MPPVKRLANTVYIGIDPGKSGGIAVIQETDVDVWSLGSMTLKDLWTAFHHRFGYITPSITAVIEQVGGYNSSEGGQPGSAMFNFGKGVGHLEMALTAAGIPWTACPPQRWQKALGIPSRKKTESKTEWKRRLRSEAERRFPNVKMTNAVADALLIAEYARLSAK